MHYKLIMLNQIRRKSTLQASKFILFTCALKLKILRQFCFQLPLTINLHICFVFFFSKKTAELIHSKRDEISADLIGSWTVQVGDMDQCVHLWRHTGGFEKIDAAQNLFENDNVMRFNRKNEYLSC